MKQLIDVRKPFINSQQAELYQRIQAFSLDAADARLPFSKRLARDNGWTIEYAQRVIDEYKKFIFLAIVADHPVTPSDRVDQVWHLHLLYTHSYWEEFCLKVLEMPLHHNPTQGGSQERRKFDDWYNKTLASYEQFFQQPPPVDIWPPSHIRFGQDLHFLRVNTQLNWILPKPQLNLLSELSFNPSAIFVLSLFLALSVTGCALSDVANLPNPLKFSLAEFTTFYLLTACFGIVVIDIIWLFRRSKTSRIRLRLVLVLILILFLLVIIKITTELSSLTGMDFLGFYSLATVTGFVLDFLTHSWAKVKPYRRWWVDYTPSWEEFMQSGIGLPSFDRAINWLIFLSISVLYLLGISRVLLGIYREKPVGYLVVLCFVVGIQLLFLLFSRFTEDFSNICRTLLAIPLLLSIPVFFWLAFRSLGGAIFIGLWIVITLLQGSNSGGGGVYWGSGSSDGDSGDSDGGDGGCGGCGGCGE